MRTIRIYTEQALEPGTDCELEAAPARHLVRVLRRRAGDALVLFNGDGRECTARIAATGPGDRCRVRVTAATAPATESTLRLELVQALARGDRMDWCIQKACELGVSAIRPVFTERTEVRLEGRRLDKRMRHWRRVAVGACEQSGRVRVPELAPAVALVDLPAPDGRGVRLDPDAERSVAELEPPGTAGISLAVGPEGGWSDAEARLLESRGYRGLRMGPRVLRSETAGPAALAVFQARFGDWR